METDNHQIELMFTFPNEEFGIEIDPQEFRMEFNALDEREELKTPPAMSSETMKEAQLSFQKHLEISKLEEIFLNGSAESPVIEKQYEAATSTPVFIVNKTKTMTTIDLTENSPPQTGLEEAHLTTKNNSPQVVRVPLKTALTGVYDLHETIHIDCDLKQYHYTSFNDEFVAGQLKCQVYKEAHQVQQQSVAQTRSRKRTIEEMDSLLKSVFEDNDDDDCLLARTLQPVVKSASLRDSAKMLSKPNTDLQSIVDEIIRPSYERSSVTATRQLGNPSHTQENVATWQPLTNPYKVVQIHEGTGQGSKNCQEANQERFQRDLSISFQAPLRPFNDESRNLNNVCAAPTRSVGRISLDVKATLKNTSNGVQPMESQLNKLRRVFTGYKCPDELMRDFHLKF